EGADVDKIHLSALKEFDNFVETLRSHGVNVIVEEDTQKPHKPDAIFPNNWLSLHQNGSIVTYPMYSPRRRKERREPIIERISDQFGFTRRYSLEQYEDEGLFLEGTGSMVLDRKNQIVYACLSDRTDPTVLDKFCALMGYDRLLFIAMDKEGKTIYHTNVMMSIGDGFAVVCLDSIHNLDEKEELRRRLSESGKDIIEIDLEQLYDFAGNILQVRSSMGESLIVMSKNAYRALRTTQTEVLSRHGKIIHSTLDTIEKYGGGSARCMMAEVFTPR
ncbi:MAG: arginine deiminase-related protein, partial [Saprospiraceae bacterium]|nr:arginine deiminase-related protein [Saprospiraceae bacterium]